MNLSTAVCLLSLFCSVGGKLSAQDDLQVKPSIKAKKIVQKLKDASFKERKIAVGELIKLKGDAVVAVLEFAKSHQDDLETVGRCVEVLTRIAENSERDDFAQKIMTLAFDELDLKKHPKLAGVSKRVRGILEEKSIPTIEEAYAAFRKVGVTLFGGSTPNIEIGEDFEGTPAVLKYARAFRGGMNITIDIHKDLEFFKVLPLLKLRELKVDSRSFGPLKISKEEVRARMAEIAKCKGIKELDIFVKQFPPEELSFLDQLPELAILSLPGSTTDDTLKIVSRLEKLRRLSIVNCESLVGHGLKWLEANKNLTSLDLYACVCEDKALQELQRLKSLTHLTLPQHSSNETTKSVSGLTNLTYLNIGNSQVTDTGLTNLVNLERLDFLVLSEVPVTGKCIPTLNSIKSLSKAFISNTFITEAESKSIRFNIDNSRFKYKKENEKDLQLVLELVDKGLFFSMHSLTKGKFDVIVNDKILKGEIDFSKLLQLDVKSLNIAYPLTKQQAMLLCKLDETTSIMLGGETMKDDVAELFHQRFKYVGDYRNGKQRITNKWKKR